MKMSYDRSPRSSGTVCCTPVWRGVARSFDGEDRARPSGRGAKARAPARIASVDTAHRPLPRGAMLCLRSATCAARALQRRCVSTGRRPERGEEVQRCEGGRAAGCLPEEAEASGWGGPTRYRTSLPSPTRHAGRHPGRAGNATRHTGSTGIYTGNLPGLLRGSRRNRQHKEYAPTVHDFRFHDSRVE